MGINFLLQLLVGANGATLATAKQTLIYKQGLTNSSITVSLGTIAANEARPVISGTSSGADKVEVRIDGVSTAVAIPDGTGAWSIPALEKPLSTGDHTITAVATNASGNTAVSSTKHTVTAAAITIDDGASVTTNDRTPTIRGNTNAANGATVTVTLNGKPYTTTASNRRWKVEVPDTLTDGNYPVLASITGASATQDLTVDGSTNVSIEAPSGSITATKPELKGTTEANNAVTLKVTDSQNIVTFIQNVVADSTGNWAYTPATDLAKGTYSITVVAADAYGNEATAIGSFTIDEAQAITVSTVDAVFVTVDYGTDESTAKSKLPATVTGKLSNDENFTADVDWSATATPAYDGNTASDYVYKGTLSNLPTGVDNIAGMTATATVTVAPEGKVAIVSATDVTKTVEYGTSLTDAKATLPMQVTVTLSDNTTKDVAVVWSENSLPTYDGDIAKDYVFSGDLTLEEGIINSKNIKAIGTITVQSAILKSDNDILTYSFGVRTATVNPENHTIEIELPAGTDVTELIASFTLSDGARAEIGEVKQVSGTTVNDFTTVVTYTVIAENGSKQQWTVTVTLKQKEQTSAPSFSPVYVGDPTITGTADAAAVVTIQNIGSATADSAGVWTITVPDGVTLKVGDELTATAKATNKDESEVSTVTVRINIKSFDELSYKVFKNTSESTFKALFSSSLTATLDDTTTSDVAVVWDLSDVDLTTPDTVIVSATLGTLSKNVYNNNSVYPTATVTVLDNLSIVGSNDGSKKITVTGAQPSASVQLYDSEGEPVGEPQLANAEGEVIFTAVDLAKDYYVIQTITVNGQSIVSPNSNKVDVADLADNKLIISGSIDGLKTVTISNATPGATITLYDKEGEVVATATADENGKVVFTKVTEGLDYYATETIDGKEAKPSSKVDVLPKIKIRYLEKDIWESVTLDVFAMKQLLSEKYPITWISTDANVLKVTAQVDGEHGDYQVETARPEKEDKSVILTAKFTFEGKEIVRTFLLVVKGKNFGSKTTSNSNNNVSLGNGSTPLTGSNVTRTTLTGTGGQQELVDKLIIDETSNLSGEDVSITFDNKSNGKEADEQAVEIASGALGKIKGDLTVVTPEGTFNLPQEGIGTLTAQGNDLFFRIVPIRSETEKQAVIDRTKAAMNNAAGNGKRGEVIDIPREIETNYSDIETWITLPIKATFTKSQAEATLRLYIEHTNGVKELITPGVNGAILVDANGDEIKDPNAQVAGLKFKIDHFSTFTFFKIATVSSSGGGGGSTSTTEVTVERVVGELVENTPVAVEGKTNAAYEVAIYVDDEFIATVVANTDGVWKYDILAGLSAGEHTVKAIVKNTQGQEVSSQVMKFTIQAEVGMHTRYIYGFTDGTFGPAKPVTRAQMAAMLVRNLTNNNIPVAKSYSYKDTSTNWARNEIEYANYADVMKGYDATTFGPTDNVTRAQMAAIAVRWIDKQCAVDLSYSKYCDAPIVQSSFTDSKGHWAEAAIERVYSYGLMVGSSTTAFRPNDQLSRQEAVVVLNRLFLRGPLESVTKASFPDVPTSHWAFEEIEEAATDHAYTLQDGNEYLKK